MKYALTVHGCLFGVLLAGSCSGGAGKQGADNGAGGASGEGGQSGTEPSPGGSGADQAAGGGESGPTPGAGGSGNTQGGAGGGAQGGAENPAAGGAAGTAATGGSPADLLGKGDHSPGSVRFPQLATAAGCLAKPTDLAFNPLPLRRGELWAVNYGDNSVCIVTDATAATVRSERRREASHEHFMPRPMALAFGGDKTTFNIPGTFATANDSAGDGNPDDGQMWNGITLWSSALDIFGKFIGADGNSHLDMLHDSPLARGIAWEKDNIYWVFGSSLQDITRYDFVRDHGRGNSDHGDGMQWHYAVGAVKGVAGVPSHLAYDAQSKLLYIADTGNRRVARLDTASGTMNPTRHTRMRDRVETKVDAVMDGAKLTDVVPASAGLQQPAGLELFEKVLFVSDFATGIIHAFDLEGRKLNWIDTGLGAGKLGGLAVGPDRRLYFVATSANAIHAVAP